MEIAKSSAANGHCDPGGMAAHHLRRDWRCLADDHLACSLRLSWTAWEPGLHVRDIMSRVGLGGAATGPTRTAKRCAGCAGVP